MMSEQSRIEWRRRRGQQWHRVRLRDDLPLCSKPAMAASYERRALRAVPPVRERCGNCEASWRIDQWAQKRYRRWRCRQTAAAQGKA